MIVLNENVNGKGIQLPLVALVLMLFICMLYKTDSVVSTQEFPKSGLSVSSTGLSSHGFSFLDARHLVPLVPARYPFIEVARQLFYLHMSVCFTSR